MSTRRPASPAPFAVRAPGGAAASVSHPACDVVESPQAYRLVFEVPGSDPQRLVVEVKERLVAVRGDRRPTEGGRFLRVEREPGPFERIVELPEEIDADAARASYVDGLLTLELPKRARPRGREIPVRPARDEGAR